MQNAATVLDVIRKRGERGLPVERLYRQLFNPQLYLLAYSRIYSNQGAMTPGVTAETAHGMSVEKIGTTIDALHAERYRFSPARRVYIGKKGSAKKRPLGLPPWSDKLVAEVVRLLLEAYYDVQFSDRSHGFRPAVMVECDQGFLLVEAGHEAHVAGAEVGGVAGAGGGHGGGAQGGTEPAVAVASAAGFVPACGLVVAGADPGPGGQVSGGAESGHVAAGLDDEHLGGGAADSGNGFQQFKLAGEGRVSSSIHMDSSVMAALSWSMRSRCRRHRKAWCSPKLPVSASTRAGISGRMPSSRPSPTNGDTIISESHRWIRVDAPQQAPGVTMGSAAAGTTHSLVPSRT